MASPTASTELVDRIPDPPAIRARLTELAAEANLLRALLRLWESRECGKRVIRQRKARPEVCRA